MPKRYISQYLTGFHSRESMFIVYCLEFTHSRRDHKVLLFYNNSTSLHKEHPLSLRIGQDTLQTTERVFGPEDFYSELSEAYFCCQALMATKI
jgi:hypothetical protein